MDFLRFTLLFISSFLLFEIRNNMRHHFNLEFIISLLLCIDIWSVLNILFTIEKNVCPFADGRKHLYSQARTIWSKVHCKGSIPLLVFSVPG